jgi:hypothetical protein
LLAELLAEIDARCRRRRGRCRRAPAIRLPFGPLTSLA